MTVDFGSKTNPTLLPRFVFMGIGGCLRSISGKSLNINAISCTLREYISATMAYNIGLLPELFLNHLMGELETELHQWVGLEFL